MIQRTATIRSRNLRLRTFTGFALLTGSTTSYPWRRPYDR